MDNHYHLLLSTPDANLSRIMRHINGVYTQRYNQLTKTDGPLFRGRYKAQLIDDDCYQLIVSRYIHLNPVDAGVVKYPVDYEWSSYRAYLGMANTPDWLSKDIILKNLTSTKILSHVKNYKDYVEEKDIDEINIYSSIKNTVPIIGSEKFKQKILSQLEGIISDPCSPDFRRSKTVPEISIITKCVCDFYKIDYESLLNCKSATLNWAYLMAVYICRKKYGHMVRSISSHFNVKRPEYISAKIRKSHNRLLKQPALFNDVDAICDLINKEIENS